jgi:hypothetical protein
MVLFTQRQIAAAVVQCRGLGPHGRGGRVVLMGRDGGARAPRRWLSWRWSDSRSRSARGNAGPPRPRRPSRPTPSAAASPGTSTPWTASPRPMVKPLVVGGRPGPPLCCRARTHSSNTGPAWLRRPAAHCLLQSCRQHILSALETSSAGDTHHVFAEMPR